jgi:hypothetical protein
LIGHRFPIKFGKKNIEYYILQTQRIIIIMPYLIRDVFFRQNLFSILGGFKTRVMELVDQSLQYSINNPIRARALACIRSWNTWIIRARTLLRHAAFEGVWNCLSDEQLFESAAITLTEFFSHPVRIICILLS